MSQSTPNTNARPFWQTALIAAVLTIGANLIIYFLTKALGVSYLFPQPLTNEIAVMPPSQVIVVSLLAIIGAIIAWLLVKRFSSQPARIFRILAVIVLVISFVPDLVLPPDLGTELSLMAMHVASFIIIVGVFTRD